jgi:thiol:disulfide interchange protein DsbC
MRGSRCFLYLLLIFVAVPAMADESAKAKEVRESFRKHFPGTPADTAALSPIKGLWEISVGSQLIYYAPEERLLVIGGIFSPKGEDLSSGSRRRITTTHEKAGAESLSYLEKHLDQAVKVGNGRNRVIEISDPDCQFCRRAHEFFESRTDVTRYVFLYPLSIHPQAAAKVSLILQASDPAAMLREVYAGKHDGDPSLPAVSERAARVSGLLGQAQVTGTPVFLLNGAFVAGADLARLKTLLEQK